MVGPEARAVADCGDVDELLARSGMPVHASLPVTYDPKALARLEQGEGGTGRGARTLLLRSARAVAEILAAPSGARAATVLGARR